MWWSFALGADLGGDGTAIAARERIPITFWQFRKNGAITTAATTVVAWGYVWLRYFAFG